MDTSSRGIATRRGRSLEAAAPRSTVTSSANENCTAIVLRLPPSRHNEGRYARRETQCFSLEWAWPSVLPSDSGGKTQGQKFREATPKSKFLRQTPTSTFLFIDTEKTWFNNVENIVPEPPAIAIKRDCIYITPCFCRKNLGTWSSLLSASRVLHPPLDHLSVFTRAPSPAVRATRDPLLSSFPHSTPLMFTSFYRACCQSDESVNTQAWLA